MKFASESPTVFEKAHEKVGCWHGNGSRNRARTLEGEHIDERLVVGGG